MKLAVLALGAVLATACYAQAEPAPVYAGPPGGYVGYGPPPMAPVVVPIPVEAQAQAQAQVDIRMVAPQAPGPLRAEVLAQFDHNRDGHLDVRERQQALRALRRLTRQLAREERRQRRAMRAQRQGAPRAMRQPRVDVDEY
jgi:hypothetical protein